MGLGTTKKKLVAYTAIQRLIADDDITTSSKIGLLKYQAATSESTRISLKDKSLAEYLRESAKDALPARYRKAYNYANTGQYAYGLPTADSIDIQSTDINAVIKDYIETSLSRTVTMVYANIGDANYYHFLWHKLINNYGYNPTTNELTTFSSSVGFPCYLNTAKLFFGYYTVNAYETGQALSQQGFSTESGACLTRSQDLGRTFVGIDVNTGVDDAYVEASYKYIEIVPDTTPPPQPIVNTLSTTTINGYGEKDSTLDIYVNSVLLTTITADANGYFNHTFSPAIVNADVVGIVVKDAALNTSSVLDTVVPYTNPSPATVGSDATVTEVEHTVSFTFDFLDYISSAKPVIPAEPEDTPTVVTGDDSYAPDYDFIQACYTYTELGVTHIGYLTYAYGSNTNAALEDLFNVGTAFGEFYPRLYIRLNNQKLTETLSTTSSEYKSSKRLGKLLGMGWQEVSDSLHKSLTDSGQDPSEVSQMFIGLAAPMNTSDVAIIEYLYKYWNRVYDELTTLSPKAIYTAINGKVGTTYAIKDNVYTHFIGFDVVSKHTVTGSIGVVGSFNTTYVNAYIDSTNNYTQGTGVEGYTENSRVYVPNHHIYRFQTNSTSYVEIRVYSARSVHSFSGTSTTAVGTDENLVIPIDKSLINTLTQKEKEILFNKSFYVFVNIAKIIKIKWYARGAFKIVLTVIAVAIAVFSVGSGAPLSAYLIAIVEAVAISLAIKLVIKLLVKLGVSVQLATALAIIAAIATGYSAYTGNDVIGLNAIQLLQATSYAFELSAKISQLELKKLSQEAELFSQEVNTKQEELERVKDLLNNNVLPPDLLLLLNSNRSDVFITLGADPEDLLAKSPVNNIDILNTYAEQYVDIITQPPTLQQLLNLNKRGDDYAYV